MTGCDPICPYTIHTHIVTHSCKFQRVWGLGGERIIGRYVELYVSSDVKGCGPVRLCRSSNLESPSFQYSMETEAKEV